jgi:hypothetical protein
LSCENDSRLDFYSFNESHSVSEYHSTGGSDPVNPDPFSPEVILAGSVQQCWQRSFTVEKILRNFSVDCEFIRWGKRWAGPVQQIQQWSFTGAKMLENFSKK